MSAEGQLLHRREGRLAWLTLDRPAAANALGPSLLEALSERLDEVRVDPAVGAVAITGAGEVFSAGADISYLHRASPPEVRALAHLAVHVTDQIETLGKPVVAALNGHALGGGLELAEACTLRVAAAGARLGHPEVRIGAIAGWGGTTRLARLIGKGRAAEMLLTGATVTAERALQLGLVNRVVAADDLVSEVRSLVDEMTSNAPLAVRMTWEALHRGADVTATESARLGADFFGLVAETGDFREGTEAFLKKRPPAFEGV